MTTLKDHPPHLQSHDDTPGPLPDLLMPGDEVMLNADAAQVIDVFPGGMHYVRLAKSGETKACLAWQLVATRRDKGGLGARAAAARHALPLQT